MFLATFSTDDGLMDTCRETKMFLSVAPPPARKLGWFFYFKFFLTKVRLYDNLLVVALFRFEGVGLNCPCS